MSIRILRTQLICLMTTLLMQKNIAESIRGSNFNHLDYVASYQPTQLIFLKTNSLLFDCFFVLRIINPSNSTQFLLKSLLSICDVFSSWLRNIKRSLTTGVFPDNRQKALVTQIPKGGDKSNLNNHRSIYQFRV